MKRFLPTIFGVVFLLLTSEAYPGTVMVPGASGGAFSVQVVSQQERRFSTTHRQQYDFSCGSAALATLLTFHYNDSVSEQEVFKAMYDDGDHAKIRKEGFSLLDIKNFLKKRGYKADGFKTSLTKLKGLGLPALVLINNEGYRHFVVVKGVTDDEVLMGDPSQGIRRIPRDKFESMWNGLLFLIRDNVQVANLYFNLDDEWQIHPRAPLGQNYRVGNEVAFQTWLLPGKNDF